MYLNLKNKYRVVAEFNLEAVIPLLQEALTAEFQQWDLYYAYKSQLKGLARTGLADEFEQHAKDEADHIDILQRHLVGMGVQPTVQRRPIPEVKPDIQSILTAQLAFEQAAVNFYSRLLSLLPEESALRIDIEAILSKEQEHVHDLSLFLNGEESSIP